MLLTHLVGIWRLVDKADFTLVLTCEACCFSEHIFRQASVDVATVIHQGRLGMSIIGHTQHVDNNLDTYEARVR